MSKHCCTNMYEGSNEGICPCGCGRKMYPHYQDSEGSCHCAEKFLEIADEAWKEVLKEKIKEKIVAKKGEHIEKLAEIIATANGEKWKHKISAKTKNNEFKDSLKELFSSCD